MSYFPEGSYKMVSPTFGPDMTPAAAKPWDAQAEVAGLKAQLAELREWIASQQVRIADLEEQIAPQALTAVARAQTPTPEPVSLRKVVAGECRRRLRQTLLGEG